MGVGLQSVESFYRYSAHLSQSMVWNVLVSRCCAIICAEIIAWSEPVHVLCGGEVVVVPPVHVRSSWLLQLFRIYVVESCVMRCRDICSCCAHSCKVRPLLLFELPVLHV